MLFCAGVIGNCEEGNVPIDEYRRCFKTYHFVQGVDVGNIPEKLPALTGGSDICEWHMWSWIYSQKYINFCLQPPGYTSRTLKSQEEDSAFK